MATAAAAALNPYTQVISAMSPFGSSSAASVVSEDISRSQYLQHHHQQQQQQQQHVQQQQQQQQRQHQQLQHHHLGMKAYHGLQVGGANDEVQFNGYSQWLGLPQYHSDMSSWATAAGLQSVGGCGGGQLVQRDVKPAQDSNGIAVQSRQQRSPHHPSLHSAWTGSTGGHLQACMTTPGMAAYGGMLNGYHSPGLGGWGSRSGGGGDLLHDALGGMQGGGSCGGDNQSDEDTPTSDDLEQFAKQFKQRRIKLGFTQVLYMHIYL